MANEPELQRLYDTHANAVYSYLLNLTRNQSDSHDILQDVFCHTARHHDTVANAREERAFLLRVAYNSFIDSTRRRRARELREQSFAQDTVGLFEQAAQADEATFRRELESAMSELPIEQRSVVHLRLWEGLTFDEIATLMQIPASTAASRYRYGIDKLRDRLRQFYDELI